jgi:thiamine-phosphate pyrophosphorylase
MRIVVISPESADSRELPAMNAMFAAGLARYHVRKPAWSPASLEAWLGHIPEVWRPRIILHQHHALAAKLGLGGTHDRDEQGIRAAPGFSRSCHDLASLRQHLPQYESIFFGPVFPSISKPGYAPAMDFAWDELKAVLRGRSAADARVFAVGGVTSGGLHRCLELGFDGAGVLGAVWNEMDPVGAYLGIRDLAAKMGATRYAA